MCFITCLFPSFANIHSYVLELGYPGHQQEQTNSTENTTSPTANKNSLTNANHFSPVAAIPSQTPQCMHRTDSTWHINNPTNNALCMQHDESAFSKEPYTTQSVRWRHREFEISCSPLVGPGKIRPAGDFHGLQLVLRFRFSALTIPRQEGLSLIHI